MSSDDPRIARLLEEALDTDRTPESVCADYPELLAEVRERYEQCRLVNEQIEALFPQSRAADAIERGRPSTPPLTLPQIPGYEILAELGHGGMGVVYRAKHLKLHRQIALKMLLAGAYASRSELQRFIHEAETIASLQHPHIVQVHDIGDLDGRPYFTMELVEGGNLGQKLAGMPQPARQAAHLAATLASAVEAAHRIGIVHRDLKPANVLLTADGTPKITDFGLARSSSGDDAGVTLTGARLGTPSYMSPEQAVGKPGTVGPAADIYALGAILYEMLTGRPPFRGESSSDTERQVISEEPVPPSRLVPKVPRDIETVCLKCLQKDPQRRYATADALADDLRRFGRGEPVMARRPGRVERVAKWVRRRPAMAVAIAATAVVFIGVLAAGLWLASDRAATMRAVEGDLTEIVRDQQDANWPAARAALDRARFHIGKRGFADLRRRLDGAARDAELVDRLEAIRVDRAGGNARFSEIHDVNQAYEAALTPAGFANLLEAQAAVAARVRESNVRSSVIAALDDWSQTTNEARRRDWLLNVAGQADRDPTGWRTRVRDLAAWGNGDALTRILTDAPVDQQPVPFLLAAAQQLNLHGRNPVPFLLAIQRAHPGDFWTNMMLGHVHLEGGDNAGAVRYYQAAVAVRPDVAAGQCSLGAAILALGRTDEATDYFRRALRIRPGFVWARINLGGALAIVGRNDDAVRELELACQQDPTEPLAHCRLGDVLSVAGRDAEAVGPYVKAFALAPKMVAEEGRMRASLIRQGRTEDVRAAWLAALNDGRPRRNMLDDAATYTEYCLFIGREDAYRAVRPTLLTGLGANRDLRVGERTARACLLLPPESADELQRATAAIDAAMAADRANPTQFNAYFQFAKGLAEYRAGRMESAVQILEGPAALVLGPAPGLVAAMARHRLGQTEQARQALTHAVATYDWDPRRANTREAWIYHVLRREAETIVPTNLPAFLEDRYQPQDNDERLALASECQFNNHPRASASLFTDAFAADPALPNNLNRGLRYSAASAASLAASGAGDGAALDDAKRARLRDQARQWLHADLAAWAKLIDTADPDSRLRTRHEAQQQLTRWQTDPDLAALREPKALAELSPAEQTKCSALWEEVAALLRRARSE